MPSASQRFVPQLELLQRRAQLLSQLRQFFHAHGYWEVETPLLSQDTCIDRWLDPFAVPVDAMDSTSAATKLRYLQTSPEFAMKRLLCRGADSIVQICKAFRAGEAGESHNPEFTMVEWYRRGAPLTEQIGFVEELVQLLVKNATSEGWCRGGEGVRIPVERLTYDAAFRRFAGISAFEATDSELRHRAQAAGVSSLIEGSFSLASVQRDDLLNAILATVVEPQLATLGMVALYDYPASQAALARIRAGATPVAERFELYLFGQEICNGYQELTDPVELRSRMQQQNAWRISTGKPPLPVESRLLDEMERSGLPECSGVALGFDRLAAFCLDQPAITNLLPFPFPDA